MFKIATKTLAITMHAGDTGAFKIRGIRRSGTAWTATDILRFTVVNGSGETVMDRAYKLAGVSGVDTGTAVIEFHNDDTDTWPAGAYSCQARYYVNPSWSAGSAPAGDVTDLMAVDNYPIEGDIIRIPEAGDETPAGQGTLTILRAYGEGA